ncbi:MAG: UDP-N-acetylglucosamine--N-acetylmuramyl-(pentapeptide) pyrophosphoryl-undecaprenol N-acetylglucosamine transferase [Alphaproteobacteria bacterium]
MTQRHPILLAAGGTGGHLFPARALAEALARRGVAVAYATDRRGEGLGLPSPERSPGPSPEGFGQAGADDAPRYLVRSAPLAGRGLAGRMRGTFDLLVGTVAATRLLRSLAPAAVVGFGGYPSVPPVLAATRLGVPAIIHEQNAVLGRANRLLSTRVAAVAVAFEATERVRPALRGRVHLIGNPVRREIGALTAEPYVPPRVVGPFRLLVTGGSQGARVMADVVPGAVALLPATVRGMLAIVQQCRAEDLDRVRATYAAQGVDARLAPFFDDIACRLAEAHLVIARAGASTVAELTAAGRPAILVPYRFATDDHQSVNARLLEAAGAAWAMPEAAFSPATLAARLEVLATAPDTLAATAARARALGRPDAADALAELVLGLAATNGDSRPREAAA